MNESQLQYERLRLEQRREQAFFALLSRNETPTTDEHLALLWREAERIANWLYLATSGR